MTSLALRFSRFQRPWPSTPSPFCQAWATQYTHFLWRLRSVRGIGRVPLATLTQLPQPLLGSLAQINGKTPRSQVQVLLGEGHLNMVLSKGGFDGEVEIAFDDQLTVGLGNLDQWLKVEGIVAKPQKTTWDGQHLLMGLAGGQQGNQ